MLLLTLALVPIKIAASLVVMPDASWADYVTERAGNPYSALVLMTSFMVGVTAYLWRDRIPLNATGFVLSVAAFVVLSVVNVGAALVPFILGYATIYLGMVRFPKLPFFSSGDYSYGIYLYAFPIQQSVHYFLPSMREWYLNIALSVPITVLIAWASWILVEKPALRLRRRIK